MQIVFQSHWTSLYTTSNNTEAPSEPNHCQNLEISGYLTFPNIVATKQYLIVSSFAFL